MFNLIGVVGMRFFRRFILFFLFCSYLRVHFKIVSVALYLSEVFYLIVVFVLVPSHSFLERHLLDHVRHF